MTPHENDIAAWICTLAVRCTPRTAENIEVIARDWAPSLADLPHEAFTPQSRNAASLKWEHFPSFKQLRNFLDEWADKNSLGKAKRTLPGAEDPSLTHEDQLVLDVFRRRRSAGFPTDATKFQHLPASHDYPPETYRTRLTIALDILRGPQPRVFRYLCRTDPECASVAIERNWEIEVLHGPRYRSEEEVAAVREASERALRAIVARAPGGKVDWAKIEAQRTDAEQAARKAQSAAWAAPVDAERLEAFREANPIVATARAIQREGEGMPRAAHQDAPHGADDPGVRKPVPMPAGRPAPAAPKPANDPTAPPRPAAAAAAMPKPGRIRFAWDD